MSYYRVCPACGAFLDPNEQCDCEREPEKTAKTGQTRTKAAKKDSEAA